MARHAKTAVDYELEIAEIDSELEMLNLRIEDLQTQRRKLIFKRKRLDIATALEFIEETGLSVDDVLDFINKELTQRRCKKRDKASE